MCIYIYYIYIYVYIHNIVISRHEHDIHVIAKDQGEPEVAGYDVDFM